MALSYSYEVLPSSGVLLDVNLNLRKKFESREAHVNRSMSMLEKRVARPSFGSPDTQLPAVKASMPGLCANS